MPEESTNSNWSDGSRLHEMALATASGFLLAGGQSSRMGRNKALLELDGKTLVEIGLEKLQAVCSDVKVVGNHPELARFGVEVVPDAIAGCGPLGGIVAALERSTSAWNLFLAVDVPFVPVALLQKLLAAAKAEQAVCVMADSCGQPQPLVAVYAKAALPSLRGELEAGRWKVMSAIKAAGKVRYLSGADDRWFQNLNTPGEFAEASASLLEL